jgi:chromosome segregation ATPase
MTDLLDRLEQKSAELSQVQERLTAAVDALETERGKRTRAARALEAERKARKAAEAAIKAAGPIDELVADREALIAERDALATELEAANLQAEGLQERLTAAWAQIAELEATANRRRGLLRRRKRDL